MEHINEQINEQIKILAEILNFEFDQNILSYKWNNRVAKFSLKIGEDNNIILQGENYDSQHLMRLIYKTYKIINIEALFDVLVMIQTQIVTLYNFCTICMTQIDFNGEKIRSCDKCIDDFCAMITDDTVTSFINYDKISAYFIIKTLIAAIKSIRVDKVYKPRLKKYIGANESQSLKNLSQLIVNRNFDEKMTMMIKNGIYNEKMIYDEIGQELYSILKFAIITNRMNIISEKINSDIYDSDDKEVTMDRLLNFQLIHRNIKPEFENVDNLYYVYHGSALENWYSIMRNGLKNYSNTDMMLNGAAYGSGIYFADSVSVSFGYSNRGEAIDGSIVVSVVQLLDKDKYCKNSFYVVPDESKILLRNMIVLKHKDIAKVDKFYKERILDIKKSYEPFLKIYVKRLMTEYNKISKKYNVDVDKNHHNIWTTIINGNTFEFVFGQRYPSQPPNIRIINKTNNIYDPITNNEGYILIREFDENHWTIKQNAGKIIDALHKYKS